MIEEVNAGTASAVPGLLELGETHIKVLSWLYQQPQSDISQLNTAVIKQGLPQIGRLEQVLSELERLECLRPVADGWQLSDHLIPLPVIGQVAAGTPIEAIENQESGQWVLPLTLFRQRPTYLLRVRGDSMKDAGIFDGDLIAVRKTGQSQSGKIVVARVDNEVTVKRLRIEPDHVALMPANEDYDPIWVAPEDLMIEGEFVGIIRGGHSLH